MHGLNLLIGREPGELDARLLQPALLPGLPASVGAGLPSIPARRRPDVRQAEASPHAAVANIGVAMADFYPNISLTGDLGVRAVVTLYRALGGGWVSPGAASEVTPVPGAPPPTPAALDSVVWTP